MKDIFTLAAWMAFAPIVLAASILLLFASRRFRARRSRLKGDALITKFELVRSFPKQVWNVLIEVRYQHDGDSAYIRTRAVWDSDLISENQLKAGSTLPVRLGMYGSQKIILPDPDFIASSGSRPALL